MKAFSHVIGFGSNKKGDSASIEEVKQCILNFDPDEHISDTFLGDTLIPLWHDQTSLTISL